MLLQRGTLSKITGRAYVAGVLPFKVGELFLIAENPDSSQNLLGCFVERRKLGGSDIMKL